jgi:phage tail protein X
MRKILSGLFVLTFTASLAVAQDAATQQQLDQITGKIQDIYVVLDKQSQRITVLEKSVGDLQDKLNQPAANNGASADDLKKLAQQVKELAKKQQDDNDQIVKTLEKLAKGGGVSAPPRSRPTAVSTENPTPTPPGSKQNGYYYEVKDKDTLIAIAKAYSAELKTKITVDQILAANPGLTAKNLSVGKKIFIPDPTAK